MSKDAYLDRLAIEHGTDAILYLDHEGYPEYINGAGTDLTGYRLSELQSLHSEEWILAPLVAEPGIVRYITLEETLPGNKHSAEDYVFVHHRSGTWLPVHIRLVRIPDSDTIDPGYILYLRDARAIMKMLDRMAELEQHALLDGLTDLPNRRAIDQER